MKDYSFVLDEHIMDSVAALVQVSLQRFDTGFLMRTFLNRMAKTRLVEADDYIRMLEKSPVERALFVEEVMVGYSAFCRNPLTWAVLESVLLPSMVMQKTKSRNKEIRLWSAACAAGQEVYCLAMMMEEMDESQKQNLKYRIFGTDFNKNLIQKASKGVYPSNVLGNITWERVQKWFIATGDDFCVIDELKQAVDFSVFDLFDQDVTTPPPSIYGDFDLVMCANLLFYYKKEFRVEVLSKIIQGMTLPGYIVTGEAERHFMHQLGFQEFYPWSAIFAVEQNSLAKILKIHKP